MQHHRPQLKNTTFKNARFKNTRFKNTAFKIFGVLKFLVPLIYVVGAIFVWIIFASSNPDGLANIWIVIYTLPIFIIGTLLLHLQFPYMPGGYYQAHALYFWLSVTLLAITLFLIFHGLQKLIQQNVINDSSDTS